jgi:CrcB protein
MHSSMRKAVGMPSELPQSGEDFVHEPQPFGRRFAGALSAPLAAQGGPVAAVALGGALGALARYGLGLVLPTHPGEFPWGTFVINVSGGLAIGILVVLVTEIIQAHRLVRPFLVTGILGGFTTFSTYAVETEQLLARHAAAIALAYLFGTLFAALAATALGAGVTSAIGRRVASR